MAKAEFKVKVPGMQQFQKFLTDARVSHCLQTECKFNGIYTHREELDCGLKEIQLGMDGSCQSFEPLVEEKNLEKGKPVVGN
jgi:hypothetical protein